VSRGLQDAASHFFRDFVDAAPPMLAIAREADSTIDWREGNAMNLPVQMDERFSLVVCHQGCNSSRTN
jgi:ubiquinone/menaquinone biosynthesis C-methylase UbiE